MICAAHHCRIQFYILLFWMWLPVCLTGQDYKFEYLSVGDGLSQVSVNAILQDSRGFLWFGTDDGLNKYDGYNFTVFYHQAGDSNSLPHNQIRALLEDSEKRLWIATTGGLACMDLKTYRIQTYPLEAPFQSASDKRDIRALLLDRFGDLWLGTRSNGLYRAELPGGQSPPQSLVFEHFVSLPNTPQSLCSNEVEAILETSDGNLWVGTENGVSRVERQQRNDFSFTTFQHIQGDSRSLSHNDIETLFQDRSGSLWIGGSGGLSRFDFASETFDNFLAVADESGQFGNIVWSIFEDSDDQFWIGTLDGLALFDRQKMTAQFFRYDPVNRRSISNSVIQAIIEDHSGVLWIATAGGGVNKLNSHRAQFRHYLNGPRDDGNLVSRSITALFEDPDGTIWAGTLEHGLFCLHFKDDGPGQAYHAPEIRQFSQQTGTANGLSHNNILSITGDSAGNLWIGTWGGGLNYFDRKSATFRVYRHEPNNPQSLRDPEDEVRALLVDSRQRLWAGTDAGLHLMTGTPTEPTFRVYQHDPADPQALPGNNILHIFEDSKSQGRRLWISTLSGFSRADIDDQMNIRFTRYTDAIGPAGNIGDNAILNIHEDTLRNVLWLGTFGGGLVRFDIENRKFSRMNSRDGLPNDIVYAIMSERGPHLWISTNRGLARFNPDDPARTVYHYNLSDGLQSDIFSANAALRSRSGQLLFGGINGLNAFYPEDVTVNRYKPPIIITHFKEFDKVIRHDITRSDTLQLSHNDNFFSFEFSALDFTNPSKNRYAYKLEGFDKVWRFRSADNRQASYTNLDGGEYLFRVRGSNNDGVWNEQGLAVSVLIHPPFWARPWVRGLFVLLSIAATIALLKLRLRRVERQAVQLEQQVKERTAELKARQTDLQKQAMKLENANQQLQLEVVERRKAEENADRANRAKSEFLTSMNHELRTPLNGILGYSEIIRKHGSLTTKQSEAVRIIKQCGKHLLQIINDLLDFSRIEAGKLEIHERPFRFPAFLTSLSAMVRLKAEEGEVVYLERFDSELPEAVLGDDKRIRQILLNLLNNAVKFTALKDRQPGILRQVEFEVQRLARDQIRFLIRDSGIGIAKEHLHDIFQPFYQVARQRHYVEGTGLGLGICRKLAHLLDSELIVESELDVGSVFRIDLRLPEVTIEGQASARNRVQQDSSGDQHDRIIVLPPKEDLDTLAAAIRIGDIGKIIQLLDQIEQNDAQLTAFLDPLRNLAKSFEIDRLKTKFEKLKSSVSQASEDA